MANEQVIDEVISPVAPKQVTDLTTLLAELDIQMVGNIKSANALNVATSNSKTFGDYTKNATAAALATEKITQAQNKTAQTTVALNQAQAKAAADEQLRQDKALAALQKRQSAQAISDAREIAQAEAKAEKLQAIQDESIRKANVQFPPSQAANNPVTQEPSAVEGVMPGGIANQSDYEGGVRTATAATAAETAAMLEQQEVLGTLTVEQRANIETLLALQAERAANALELKELNVQDAVSGERAIFLTAEQLKLKVAIAEVTVELNRQTKAMLSEDGATKQLGQSVLLLREAYDSLSPAERNSANGQKQLAELQALDTEYKALKISTGDTSKEVGAYEKAIAKATNGSQLAATAVNVATRSIIRMVVQFALFGVILQAAQWLFEYIKALDMFNPIASEAERRQKALVDAFASGDYTKGVENVEKLGASLDLANKHIGDSDSAINLYNESIGKTFGYVNNLTDAQKGFESNSDKYIQSIYLEAAAQAVMNDASKEAADILVKNQKLRNEIEDYNKGKLTLAIALKEPFSSTDPHNNTAENDQKEIDANTKKVKAIFSNAQGAIESFMKDQNKVTGQTTTKVGADATAELANKIANESLEREKEIAQSKVGDEKLSYKTRLQAAQEFYNASVQIEKNNEALQLKELPANDARKEDIEKDAANKLLQLKITYTNQVQTLNDKAYKQDQEILKNNLEKQRDLFKSVFDDPNQSYDMKLIALGVYNKKSAELIKANYDEQIKASGKNAKSVTLAEQTKAKAIIQLDNETAQERLKIQKENLAKILEVAKESEEEQLQTLDNASKIALLAINKVKDDKENSLSLERAQGKISEKKYNDELLLLNDEFNIQKISQELETQRVILALREGQRDATLLRAKVDGATPDELKKISSNANKGIQPTKDNIANLGAALGNAQAKLTIDQTKSGSSNGDKKKNAEIFALEQTGKAVDELDKLRQRAYENEIARLEKLSQQIDDNAQQEKDAVNNSIVSSSTKAREINLIDAKAAIAKKNIAEQEAQQKEKAAIADKEASVAKIILSTAEAAIKAPAELGPLLGLAAVPVVLALGAVELALAIATPIPKFAMGTKNYPGGLGLWGEAGTELATLPSGKQVISDGPGLANFPKGTVITPHMELMQMIRPDAVKYVGGQEIGWKEVLSQLKKMEPKNQRNKISVNLDMGFEIYKQQFLRR